MKVLDAYCGQGGAGMGYARAGFDVVGVDIRPQPRYPFTFIQADALEFLATADLSSFDLIHASPPCQRYSVAMNMAGAEAGNHPDLLPATRTALEATGKPYVIENVPGAPMRADLKLCGCQFGLWRLKRERWFETSWRQEFAKPACHHPEISIVIIGSTSPSYNRERLGFTPNKEDWQKAMGIDWMTRKGMSEAIPPAYSEFTGKLAIGHLARSDFAEAA